MKFTSEQIQQLLIEKITGTIEADDDLVIEQLLADNEEILLQWRAMQAQVQQAEAAEFSLETNTEKAWQQIAPCLKAAPKARIFSLVKIAAAAAILVVVASAIYLFNKNEPARSAITQLSAKEKRARVSLAIDDGETIYLERTDTNNFQLGAATIRARDGEISYAYPKVKTQEWGTLSVPAIMDYKIRMSDGTEVWMNSQTKLRFPFSFPGKTREVYIDGEAYFKVAKNTARPFIVHAHETAIRVLGTQFNVNTYDKHKIKTALVEGAVSASSNRKKVDIKPGFAAMYNPLQTDFQVEAFDQSEVLSWMKGTYYFHNNSLKDLSKLLSRWYNVEVQFQNPLLENKTFSGEIVKNQPIQLFLDNIRISNAINLDFKEGVVYFK